MNTDSPTVVLLWGVKAARFRFRAAAAFPGISLLVTQTLPSHLSDSQRLRARPGRGRLQHGWSRVGVCREPRRPASPQHLAWVWLQRAGKDQSSEALLSGWMEGSPMKPGVFLARTP